MGVVKIDLILNYFLSLKPGNKPAQSEMGGTVKGYSGSITQGTVCAFDFNQRTSHLNKPSWVSRSTNRTQSNSCRHNHNMQLLHGK